MRSSMVKTGLIGSVITAICSFTPILVIIFGLFGLAVYVPLLDFVLFPLLASFIGMLIAGLFLRNRKEDDETEEEAEASNGR